MTVEEKQTTVKLSASTLKMNTKSKILDDDMSAGISDMLPDQFKNGYMELKSRDTKVTNKENIASWVVGAFFEIEKNYVLRGGSLVVLRSDRGVVFGCYIPHDRHAKLTEQFVFSFGSKSPDASKSTSAPVPVKLFSGVGYSSLRVSRRGGVY